MKMCQPCADETPQLCHKQVAEEQCECWCHTHGPDAPGVFKPSR